jgi:hypothetical protein
MSGGGEMLTLAGLALAVLGGFWGVLTYLLGRIEGLRKDLAGRIAALETTQRAYMDRAEVLQHFNRVEEGVRRVHERMDRFMELAAGKASGDGR